MNRFNLRVYAIIINPNNEVLVSDELRFGKTMTKFPGGGMEQGEGTKDTLQRELQEELGVMATIGELFYVNDFFQESAFRKEDQLISFYHFIDSIDFLEIVSTNHTIPLTEEGEKFRWVSLTEISSDHFTFPIDKVVAEKLRQLESE